jgi:RND family efflux transporter MFP subunit
MKKKAKLGLIFLACLVAVGLTACGGQTEESQQQIVKVTRGDIVVSITADGNLSLPWDRKLTFGTAGIVEEINVEQGDWVTEGQVLASLDTTSLKLAARSAEADLESAVNSLRQLTTPYPYSTFAFALPESLEDVRVAQQGIKEAQEELEKGLEGKQYSITEVKEKLRLAQDSLTEAETKLACGLGEGITSGQSYWTLRAAQIAVEKAQIDLDIANNNLEEAIIAAPFDGVVAVVDVKQGERLSSVYYATTTIIEVIDPTIMELKVDVDEIDIPDVELNQRAIISVDALPDIELEGEVASISPVSTEESGIVMYEVTVGFDIPQGSALKSGMSAGADIIVNERSDVLLVPDRAISYDGQGNTVVEVVLGAGTEQKSVVIGISDGFYTEIVEGLNEGDLVVIES